MSADPKTRILEFGQTQAIIFQTMQTTLTNLLASVQNLSLSPSDIGSLDMAITSLQKNTAHASGELDGINAFANQLPSNSSSSTTGGTTTGGTGANSNNNTNNNNNGLNSEELVLAQSALAEQQVVAQAINTCLSYLGHLANQLNGPGAASIPADTKTAMQGNLTSAQDAAGAAIQSGVAVQGNLTQLVQALGGTVTNGS
ncbi:MAG: hypothetical protein M1822_007275 [Bathelium mastoideum]|nr:MAG: hypothetical protein M1822_007275 [Bathelium mastoideum]